MEEKKMCIKTFNITEEQAEFIKNNADILRISESKMLRNILSEYRIMESTIKGNNFHGEYREKG